MNRPPVRPATTLTAATAAELLVAITPAILHAVIKEHKRLGPALAFAMKGQRPLAAQDRLAMSHRLGALLRWWGWIEPLSLRRADEQLLLAWLLDSPELDATARAWAAKLGRRPEQLVSVGDAPTWTTRAEGLKRFMEGRPVNADPWRLFPAWLREHLPVPPGNAAPKERRLKFLAALQTPPPLWVGARAELEKSVWAELRDAGTKPWVHRHVPSAAKLPPETDLSQYEAFRSGRLVAQDLASQAVGIVCDPDPGERWWDLRPESGLHAVHLAALMVGKGAVVCTFERERQRHATALRLRPGAFHNITTRLWDCRHPPGKPASYDGALVDAVCSGIGSWRRHPDARWVIAREEIPALAARQLQCVDAASKGVRPGGTLVYSVGTVTPSETLEVVSAFLDAHAEFTLQPFPHPLGGDETGGTVQLWPHIHDCEARFIARMTRRATPTNPN